MKWVVADRVLSVLGGADASWVREGLPFGGVLAPQVGFDGLLQFRGLGEPSFAEVTNGELGVQFRNKARRHRGKDEPALFEVVLHGLPCEFEETFEALNDAFLLQRIERIGTVLHRAAQ